MTTAKGLTSGYVPMGAVFVAPRVAEPFFDPAAGRLVAARLHLRRARGGRGRGAWRTSTSSSGRACSPQPARLESHPARAARPAGRPPGGRRGPQRHWARSRPFQLADAGRRARSGQDACAAHGVATRAVGAGGIQISPGVRDHRRAGRRAGRRVRRGARLITGCAAARPLPAGRRSRGSAPGEQLLERHQVVERVGVPWPAARGWLRLGPGPVVGAVPTRTRRGRVASKHDAVRRRRRSIARRSASARRRRTRNRRSRRTRRSARRSPSGTRTAAAARGPAPASAGPTRRSRRSAPACRPTPAGRPRRRTT